MNTAIELLIRIHTYQGKGDLARFEDVLDYLNRRDAPKFPKGLVL
jgi:hypothetical protein